MITLLTVCMFVLLFQLLGFILKLTWGITKIIFCIIGLPLLVFALIFSGIITLGLPILFLVLCAVFLLPVLKRI